MPKQFEIILVSMGNQKDTILGHLQDSSNLEQQKVIEMMENLPATIKITENKMEAVMLKSALEMMGAKVEIKEITTTNISTGPVKINFKVNRIQHTNTNNPNTGIDDQQYTTTNPVQRSKGCFTIIFSGFLITLIVLLALIIKIYPFTSS